MEKPTIKPPLLELPPIMEQDFNNVETEFEDLEKNSK